MGTHTTLIRGGYVLSMDPRIGDLVEGDVLVRGDRITEVAPAVSEPADTVIDARGTLVVPGFVDTHIHLWQTPLRGMTADLWAREYFHIVHPMSNHFAPEDMYWSAYAGALELISHGVTSAFDYCHSVNSPDHADESLRGLRDAGIRGRFGFGLFERESATYRDRAQRLADLTRLAETVRPEDPLGLALAIDHAYDETALGRARELGLVTSVHGNPVGLLAAFADAGALGPDVLWVHGNYATTEELDALAGAGGTLSLTPDIELGMGKPVTIFDRAARQGLTVTLGVDVTSYASAGLLVAMRQAYQISRVLDGMAERERGHVPPLRTASVPTLTARQVLAWATVNGAAALGLADVTGSLTPGKKADLLLIDTRPFGMSMGDPAAHVVLQATSRDISTVMIDGQVRVLGGRLVDVDVEELGARLYETRERLLGTRGLGERVVGPVAAGAVSSAGGL
jgi:cytosine/adenosine deaminase-related metal-dependent hydrolase